MPLPNPTPTSPHSDHDKLKAAGAEVVACVSVNDPFVMAAWGEQHGAGGKVVMLADTR